MQFDGDSAVTEHEDWCPFTDHKGECYEALMECMEKADPERWAALIEQQEPDAPGGGS